MKGIVLIPSLLLLALCFVSCTHKKIQITRSCYYWASSSFIHPSKKEFLKKHAVRKIYARLMDVDWKQLYGAYPVATNGVEDLSRHINSYDSLSINTVPVVFITNKTFLRISKTDIPLLAKRIARRCFPAYDSTDRVYETTYPLWLNSKRFVPQEIQFDCDWTPASAANYFYFLAVFRSLLPDSSIRVSATIRLHQYKYSQKTGIPPVDRGMLMIYNLHDLKQYNPVNSIFDVQKASAYFGSNNQ